MSNILKATIERAKDIAATIQSSIDIVAIQPINPTYFFMNEEESVAYAKNVPDAAALTRFDYLGGKSLVWNQLCSKRSDSGNYGGVTVTDNKDGSFTFNGTSTSKAFFNFQPLDKDKYVGHKLLLKLGAALSGTNTYFTVEGRIGDPVRGEEAIKGKIITVSAVSKVNNPVYIYIFDVGAVFDNVVYRPQIFDLTLMFGAGNEPTVEQFNNMFPNNYYPYNTGEIKSASVNEVVSVGKNLLKNNTSFCYEVMPPRSELNWTYATQNKDTLELTNDGVHVKFKSTQTASRFNILVTCDSSNMLGTEINIGDVISCSCDVKGSVPTDAMYSSLFAYYDPATKKSVGISYDIITPNISPNEWTRFKFENIVVEKLGYNPLYPDANETAFLIEFGFSPSSDIWIRNIQLEKSSTATPYSPYKESTFSIPQSILDLPGYGWSAGNVTNYVDFENKKYHQRVGSVDLGSLTWYKATTTTGSVFYSGFVKTEMVTTTNYYKAIIGYPYIYTIASTSTMGDKTYHYRTIANREDRYIYIRDDDYPDKNSFTTAMSGILLYYELPEEVIIDLPDSFPYVEVEGGGSLEFHQNEFHIPVPNKLAWYSKTPQTT